SLIKRVWKIQAQAKRVIMPRSRLMIAALASVAAVASSPAQASLFVSGIGSVTPVSGGNDFAGNLAGLGLTQFTTSYSGFSFDNTTLVSLYKVAAESSFQNVVTWPVGNSNQENNESFDGNRLIG